MNSYENLWDKCKEAVGRENEYPEFYFSCGTEDFLYPSYLDFKKYASEIGFKATFEEKEGYAHEWRFWEVEIQRTLQEFGLVGKRNITTEKSLKKIDASNL